MSESVPLLGQGSSFQAALLPLVQEIGFTAVEVTPHPGRATMGVILTHGEGWRRGFILPLDAAPADLARQAETYLEQRRKLTGTPPEGGAE